MAYADALCGSALSEACRTRRTGVSFPQLAQWVVQISHLRCSVGGICWKSMICIVSVVKLKLPLAINDGWGGCSMEHPNAVYLSLINGLSNLEEAQDARFVYNRMR